MIEHDFFPGKMELSFLITLTSLMTSSMLMVGTDGASIRHHLDDLKLVWLPADVRPPQHLNGRQPFIRVQPSRKPKQFLGAR